MSYTTTATNSFSGNNTVIVTTIANMLSGLPIVFTGNVFGNITANATFYIGNITGSNQITLSSLPGGAVYAVANGSGNMTATFSTGGQQIIDVVPPGDPLDVAFEKTNVNFDQIFAAGPVGSNIQIANNTIRTINTNGNLILSPNGIGNVVSNVNIVPNTANLRNLGSPTQRWATIYTQYIDYTAGNISFSNFSVSGNISAGGYISAAGNVTGNYILGNGSLLTGISVSTNKIFNGNSYANIATANGNVVISANGAIWSFNTNGTTAFPAFTFPNIDGANGQVLVTNGNGVIAWGNGQFSVITNQTISGNGVAGNFALAQSATSDSVFVTINGISQTPETDYTVLGNVITFTTIPIVGDVAQIRFLAGNVLNVNYSNANVAAFLPTYSGNVSANYFIGNGSQLTGIAGGTGNTGNITFSNTTITSNVANANVTVQGNGTGNVNLGSSVSVAGNITANYLYGNGYYLTGLLTTITNQTLTGNNVETNFTLNQTATANSVLVTVNGISQTPDVDYTVSGNVITFTSAPYTGDIMQVRFLANNFTSGGGGNGDTGNITFNNTTISSNVANANIVLQAPGSGEIVFKNNSNSVVVIDSTASNVTNTIRINTQGTTLGSFGGGIIAGSYILGNGTPTQNQNRLATFIGQGSEDGTTLASPAKVRIQMAAAGNWSSGNTPTEISFFTTASGSNAASETVRIDSTGNLIIYNGNINAAGGTITAGSVSASGNVTANFFIGNGSALTGIVASANTGNVTFANINIIGDGNLHLQPDPANPSAYLDIYLTAGPDIHIAGNGETVILGTDEFANVTVNVDGNVSIQANAATPHTWTFGTDGNLTFPTGNLVITPDDPAGNIASITSTDHPLGIFSTGANGAVATVWVEDYANVGTSNIAAVYANPTPGSKIVRIAVGQNGGPGPNLWDFNANGTLTLPNGAVIKDNSGDAVAFGQGAGETSQGNAAVAVGTGAGSSNQGINAVAIGATAGATSQGANAIAIGAAAGAQGEATIAIGLSSGFGNQGNYAVAVGHTAGSNAQGLLAVAVGNSAGFTNQGQYAVAVGPSAGTTTQGAFSVAVGYSAGYTTQANSAIAIGGFAGATSQDQNAVAIGVQAGYTSQGYQAVAIGTLAGANIQGNNSVAVGWNAGYQSQGSQAVAIGLYAGNSSQGQSAVAIGSNAGTTTQGQFSVAVGQGAGNTTQGEQAVSIGLQAGFTTQGNYAVAIGKFSANTNQGTYAVAVGPNAGFENQLANAVAIGSSAGSNAQGTNSVAVGAGAAYNTQGANAVAVGNSAGYLLQGIDTVAIGDNAGFAFQGNTAVAIGYLAGNSSQGYSAVSVGVEAGKTSQGFGAVAIGNVAGSVSQGINAVAVGREAGNTSQGNNSVAIGFGAGFSSQGRAAVALGAFAGGSTQANNSIILNATGSQLNQTTANTFTVAPVRNDVANIGEVLFYNATSKEITYGNVISVAGNITGGNLTVGSGTITGGNVNGSNFNGNVAFGTGTVGGSGNITGGNLLFGSGVVSGTGNITGGNLAILGNAATITSANYSIGYLNIPQVSFAANATIALTDAGKHYYSTSASNLLLTIANNTSVSWTVGTAITIVNRGTANITIAQGTGVSLYLAGNSTSGNRTMTTYGMSTLMNVAANVWMINGTGVV